MKPETFHDAVTLLPEELLQPVDALRRKKRFSWKSVLATAACLLVVTGLAIGYARIIAPASAENEAGDMAPPQQENVSQSKAESPSLVEVVQVEADYVMVVNASATSGDSCALRAPIKLYFEKLTQVPALQVGQILEIYWNTEDYDPVEHAITPYRIVISGK